VIAGKAVDFAFPISQERPERTSLARVSNANRGPTGQTITTKHCRKTRCGRGRHYTERLSDSKLYRGLYRVVTELFLLRPRQLSSRIDEDARLFPL
jgi:hypothetical protein